MLSSTVNAASNIKAKTLKSGLNWFPVAYVATPPKELLLLVQSVTLPLNPKELSQPL